ncbi:MAG TPA: hypothetical protein PLB91_12915 [Spirochaetales bacterium]|nr:hypothetical protein [Spirochaetales bacterium]HRY55707.1 hypothetical protein [Spirochaetia bacterium]HRZ65261.1 hypothetical protein [Spirochaetia bacterium]
MKKKLIAIGVLAALVGTGAFAQVVLGLTGALHMDTELSASEIQDRFSDGEGIFYGPFIEVIFHKFGIGLAGNFSFYEAADAFGSGYTYEMMDYDITFFASYHFLGGRSFLDPFGELGFGYIATDFANEEDKDNPALNPYQDAPLFASYYWYAAIGLGLNLGPIGVFGKFAFNYPTSKDVEAEWKTGGTTDLYPYGFDSVLFPDGYLPKYRFTIGAKLIL